MLYNVGMFEKILEQNGMNEKEAKLYIVVLEAGEIPLGRAAQKAKLKRSTVYSLVEGLKKKGVLSTLKKNGIVHVSALSPRLLIERFEESAARAKSVLPSLLDLAYASPIKPRIRFYEGIEGIKQLLFEAASSGQDYIGFIDYTLMPKEVYRHILTKVRVAREKSGIWLRLLMPDNPTNRRINAEYKMHVEHRLVSFPSHKNHIEILLYEDSKVGFLSFVKGEMFAVVLDSSAIHQTLKDLFFLIWEGAR